MNTHMNKLVSTKTQGNVSLCKYTRQKNMDEYHSQEGYIYKIVRPKNPPSQTSINNPSTTVSQE